MAELFLTSEELYRLAKRASLPFKIQYLDGQLVISGTVEKIIVIRFRVKAEFRKLANNQLTLEVVETSPSAGALGDWLKSQLFKWLDDNENLPAHFFYPYISVDLRALPGWEVVSDWITVTGVEFEPQGIRITFIMNDGKLINHPTDLPT